MRLPWLGAVVLIVGAGLGAGRAEGGDGDPARAAWTGDADYDVQKTVAHGDLTLELLRRTGDLPPEGAEGAHVVLVRRGPEIVDGYRTDLGQRPGGGLGLTLAWLDHRADDAGLLVAAAPSPADADLGDLALDLVRRTLAARPAWEAAAARLAEAVAAPDLETRHPAALAAYRALERARARFPDHLGILRDVLAAEGLLVPLEVGSDRGALLGFAWRRDVAALTAASTHPDEVAVARRTMATCGFAEGCYLLAAVPVEEAGDQDELLAALRPALRAAGQLVQEHGPVRTFGDPASPRQCVQYRCPGEPVEGFLFHRLTFLTARDDPREVLAPWFSLTAERTGDRVRWALYGWVAGSRRLLRLYGTSEPDADAVTDEVFRLLDRATERPR